MLLAVHSSSEVAAYHVTSKRNGKGLGSCSISCRPAPEKLVQLRSRCVLLQSSVHLSTCSLRAHPECIECMVWHCAHRVFACKTVVCSLQPRAWRRLNMSDGMGLHDGDTCPVCCRLQLNAWQAITAPDATPTTALEQLQSCEAKRIRAGVGCIADTPLLTDAPISSLASSDVLDVQLLMPVAAAGQATGDSSVCCHKACLMTLPPASSTMQVCMQCCMPPCIPSERSLQPARPVLLPLGTPCCQYKLQMQCSAAAHHHHTHTSHIT